MHATLVVMGTAVALGVRVALRIAVGVGVVAAGVGSVGCEGRPAIFTPGSTFRAAREAVPVDGLAATRSSGGFALADLDGDGALDVVVTTGYSLRNILGTGDKVAAGPQLVLRGTFAGIGAGGGAGTGDGAFVDAAPLQGGDATAMAPLAADLDGDGDIDVVIPTAGPPENVLAGGETRVFENVDGELLPRASLPVTEGIPYAVCPGDFDKDGDLDFFVANLGAPDRLYRNDGALTFVEVSEGAGSIAAPSGWTNACLAMDIDDDGDLDLFTAYEYLPQGVVLHRNVGDLVFEDASVAVLGDATGHEGDWMGFAAGDPDGDGDVDVFVTNMGFGAYSVGGSIVTQVPGGNPLHMLLENQGDGTFKDIATDVGVDGLEPLPPAPLEYPAATRGLAGLEFGWTAWFFDYDNDGDEDLLFFGSWAFSSTWQVVGSRENGANPGRLLENDGTGRYREVARSAGIENVRDDGFIWNGWGCDVVDLDDDGFLDVVLANQYFGEVEHPQGLRVWLNDGNDNGSLAVELVGHASAPHAYGARVELVRDTPRGPKRDVRVRVSASSISGAQTSPLHFGVPKGSVAKQLTVRWPSGAVSEIDGPFERHVRIEEPQ